MAGPTAEVAQGAGSLQSEEENQPAATVGLQVRVADAQGLRLFQGGEIRLVITLRSIEDPEGAAFGLKVTPWQEVPQNCAPTWKPREAIFVVPAERCFSAEFVDSAHLHVALFQRGHTPVAGAGATTAAVAPPPTRRLGLLTLKPEGLAAALQGAVAAVQGAAAGAGIPDRGEPVGALRLAVGRRLVCPEDHGGMEGITWVQLVEPGEGAQKTKGSLLLELKCEHQNLTIPKTPAPAPAPASPKSQVTGANSTSTPASSQPQSPKVQCSPDPSPGQTSSPPPSVKEGDLSDSASESGIESDYGASQASTSSTTATRGDADASARTNSERPLALERPLVERPPVLPTIDFSRGMLDVASNSGSASRDAHGVKWLSGGRDTSGHAGFDSPTSGVNIFTINDSSASSGGIDGIRTHIYNQLMNWSKKARRRKPMQEQIRSALDSGIRKQRRAVRKWRRWHEVFCVLNEIEQRLAEVVSMLVQAAASMKQFGDSHTKLSDCARLSAFLRDATLYFQSEAALPKRLESHLDGLERVADEFRSISVQATEHESTRESQSELWKECEDLQVDIAVLLESSQMTAQHALAEYKKMHCRLELLVTEYGPSCSLELEVARPAFLPLLTDESARQVSAANVPAQAVQWALDFSQLVGNASQVLDELVRDLNHRARQVTSCSKELRDHTLRLAASSSAQLET